MWGQEDWQACVGLGNPAALGRLCAQLLARLKAQPGSLPGGLGVRSCQSQFYHLGANLPLPHPPSPQCPLLARNPRERGFPCPRANSDSTTAGSRPPALRSVRRQALTHLSRSPTPGSSCPGCPEVLLFTDTQCLAPLSPKPSFLGSAIGLNAPSWGGELRLGRGQGGPSVHLENNVPCPGCSQMGGRVGLDPTLDREWGTQAFLDERMIAPAPLLSWHRGEEVWG